MRFAPPPQPPARSTDPSLIHPADVLASNSFSPIRALVRCSAIAITALTIVFWLIQLDHAAQEDMADLARAATFRADRLSSSPDRSLLFVNSPPPTAAASAAGTSRDLNNNAMSVLLNNDPVATSDDAPTLTVADKDTSSLLLEEDTEQTPRALSSTGQAAQSFTFSSLMPESLHSQRICRQLQSKLQLQLHRPAPARSEPEHDWSAEKWLTPTLLVRDRSGQQLVRAIEAHLHTSPDMVSPASGAEKNADAHTHPSSCIDSALDRQQHALGHRFASRASSSSPSVDPLDRDCRSSPNEPGRDLIGAASPHLQTIRLSFDMQHAHSDPSVFLLQLPSFTHQLASLPIGLTVRSESGAVCHTNSIRIHLSGNDTLLRVDDVLAEFVDHGASMHGGVGPRSTTDTNGLLTGIGALYPAGAYPPSKWSTVSASSLALGSLCAHQAVVYGSDRHVTIAYYPLASARIRSVHTLGQAMTRSTLSNSPVYVAHVVHQPVRKGEPLRFAFDVTFEALAPSVGSGAAGSPAHLDCATSTYTHSTSSAKTVSVYPQLTSQPCPLVDFSFQFSALQIAPPLHREEEPFSLSGLGSGVDQATPRLYQLTLLSDEHPLDWVMLNIHTHSNASGEVHEHVDRLQMARALGRERPRVGERRSKRQLGRRLRWDKVLPYLLRPEERIDVQFTFSAAGATCDTEIRQLQVGQLARASGEVEWPGDKHELSRFVRAQPSSSTSSSARGQSSSPPLSSSSSSSLASLSDSQYDDPATANRQFIAANERANLTAVLADDAASDIGGVEKIAATEVATGTTSADDLQVPGGVFAASMMDRNAITPHDVQQFEREVEGREMEISQQQPPGVPNQPSATGGQPMGPPPRPERCESEEYFCQIYRGCYPCFVEPTGALCSACEQIFRCADEACRRQKTCLWCRQLPTENRLPVCAATMNDCPPK